MLALQEGREKELETHASGEFSKFANHGMAARVTARGRESDPRRGWKSITELGRMRGAERKRDGRKARERGSIRRPRLRRSLSAGAVAGPSCPVPRSACSPLSVFDPIVSHTNSARCIAVTVVVINVTSVAAAKSSPSGVLSCPASASLPLSVLLSFFLSLSFFPFLGLLFVESTIERIARRPRPR